MYFIHFIHCVIIDKALGCRGARPCISHLNTPPLPPSFPSVVSVAQLTAHVQIYLYSTIKTWTWIYIMSNSALCHLFTSIYTEACVNTCLWCFAGWFYHVRVICLYSLENFLVASDPTGHVIANIFKSVQASSYTKVWMIKLRARHTHTHLLQVNTDQTYVRVFRIWCSTSLFSSSYVTDLKKKNKNNEKAKMELIKRLLSANVMLMAPFNKYRMKDDVTGNEAKTRGT